MTDDGRPRPFTQTLINLLPPLTLAAVLLFWSVAPAAWLDWNWSLTTATLVTLAFVQLLELVLERHPGWRINRRELLTDLFYVTLYSTVIAWLTRTLADDPIAAIKASLGLATPALAALPYLVQVALVLILFELGQYWLHRLMHNNALLWSLHAPHHHVTQLNAIKGYVGNPIELFLISLSVLALFDFDSAAIFAAFNTLVVVQAYAHANVRADPPAFYGFVFTTIRNHSLHHTAASYDDTRCNYGNTLILLDRIFGTYRHGESAIVGQDDRQRLSIAQQFGFPFRPLIARLYPPAPGT